MNPIKHLPNFITTLNVLCGSLATVMVLNGDPLSAAFLVLLGAVFDFADGFVARLVKATSNIGKELDSLADMVTFGLVPGLILLHYLVDSTGWHIGGIPGFLEHPLLLTPMLVPMFAALRLAKFNVDARQSESFRGLPTPASALWVISIPLIIEYMPYHIMWNPDNVIVDRWFLIGSAIGLSVLMVSGIPLMAMKFKHFGWHGNRSRYVFLAVSFILLILLQPLAIPIILSLYLIISIANNLFSKAK